MKKKKSLKLYKGPNHDDKRNVVMLLEAPSRELANLESIESLDYMNTFGILICCVWLNCNTAVDGDALDFLA